MFGYEPWQKVHMRAEIVPSQILLTEILIKNIYIDRERERERERETYSLNMGHSLDLYVCSNFFSPYVWLLYK